MITGLPVPGAPMCTGDPEHCCTGWRTLPRFVTLQEYASSGTRAECSEAKLSARELLKHFVDVNYTHTQNQKKSG